jgi:hypothetical protein
MLAKIIKNVECGIYSVFYVRIPADSSPFFTGEEMIII